jgi:uncharacterized protein
LKRFVVVLGIIGIVGAFALPASAHVTVNPKEAPKGSFATLTFNVPNEKDDASTTKVEVNLPTDHPIASVSVEPVPGWQVAVQKSKLAQPLQSDDGEVTDAVSQITWSGGQITPGQFQRFVISVGPLPENTNSLVFKALQTYSDGDVVRWIETAAPGGEEPEHPAPTLQLTAATNDEQAAAPVATSDSGDDDSNTLAIVGIVLGAVALLVGAGALVMGRRTASS